MRFADFYKKFACPPPMLTGLVPTCTFQTMQGITGTSELAPPILKSCTGASPYLKNLVKNKTDIRCSGRRCWSGYAGTMLSSTRGRDSSTGSSHNYYPLLRSQVLERVRRHHAEQHPRQGFEYRELSRDQVVSLITRQELSPKTLQI
jgi:hypothetical protein